MMYPPPPAPAPRDTAQKWAAAFAVIAVVAGVSYGASVFKSRVKKAFTPTAGASATSTSAPSATVVDPEPAVPKEGLPSFALDPNAVPADDGPPPPPGTPASSLRARPPWGRLELTTRGEATQQFAPQHSKPLDLYVKSSPINGDVQRAFVICRAQSFNKADTFAGDDLHVRATFGKTPEVAADGPEDANLGFVSAPLVSIAKNEIVHVAVFDRDVFELTNLARVNHTFAGQPIVIADPGASIECRTLAGEALQSRFATEAGAADHSINALASAQLTASKSDWGYPHLEIARAHRSTADGAALVGWDDARVQKRVATTAGAIAKVEAQRPRVFDELRGGAGSETTVDGMKVTLVSVECGPRVGMAGRCAVNASLQNGSGRAVRWNGYKGPSAYVATRQSGPGGVSPTQRDLVLKDIPAGATVDVTLAAVDDKPGKEDAILGICVENRCGAIKLR
jgi:hypothetical protein